MLKQVPLVEYECNRNSLLSLLFSQVSLCGTQIWWSTEVGIAFGRLEEGYENALKDYYKKQVGRDCSLDILSLPMYHTIPQRTCTILYHTVPFHTIPLHTCTILCHTMTSHHTTTQYLTLLHRYVRYGTVR